MDIKKLASEDTHWNDPVDCALYADGEPCKDSKGGAVAVQVVGEYADTVRRALRQNQGKITRLIRQYGSIEKIPVAEMERLRHEKLAAAIVGWRGFESDGAPLPYSAANALAIVTGLDTHRPDQLKQIEATHEAHSSFFEKA